MKKILAISLLLVMLFAALGALAEKSIYTLKKNGTVLQDEGDRGIQPKGGEQPHPLISGESPTTGLPWHGEYLPMLTVISNAQGSVQVKGRTVKAAGVGKRAPWGIHEGDILFEELLYRNGGTRLTVLFSDCFAAGQPAGGVGPVRSTRLGQRLLREEWQAGLVYSGMHRMDHPAIDPQLLEWVQDGTISQTDLLFPLLSDGFMDFKYRVKEAKAPDNMNGDILGLRGLIPPEHSSAPRPFLFSDASPYGDGYEAARRVSLDWGVKPYISHFQYDEATHQYARFCGNAPYLSFASVTDRSEENRQPMVFANVILQRVSYEFINDNKLMPSTKTVGQGNADIFIGGRYIPGYWVRSSPKAPTVYYDDKGEEIRLARGKTYIAHFPPEALCVFAEEASGS